MASNFLIIKYNLDHSLGAGTCVYFKKNDMSTDLLLSNPYFNVILIETLERISKNISAAMK